MSPKSEENNYQNLGGWDYHLNKKQTPEEE